MFENPAQMLKFSSWPTERKDGFVVKALHCDLKNLGLIPSATTSLHPLGQITLCLFGCSLYMTRVIALPFQTDS